MADLEQRVESLEHDVSGVIKQVQDHDVEIKILKEMQKSSEVRDAEHTMMIKAVHKRLDDFKESRFDEAKARIVFRQENNELLAGQTRTTLKTLGGAIVTFGFTVLVYLLFK